MTMKWTHEDMNKLTFNFISILMIFSIPAWASNFNFCPKLFKQHKLDTVEKTKIEDLVYLQDINVSDIKSTSSAKVSPLKLNLNGNRGETVEVVYSSEGSYDMLYKIQRFSEDWASWKKHPDVQGDPRLIIEIQGDKLSNTLGFAKLDSKTIQYPSPAEYIYRLQLLKSNNPKLDQFFYMDFYQQNKKLSTLSYLWRFAYENKLPLQTTGLTFIHDMNFHTFSPNLIPKEFMERFQYKIKVYLTYIKYLSNYKTSKMELNFTMDRIQELANAIDHLTGQGINNIKYNAIFNIDFNVLRAINSKDPYALIIMAQSIKESTPLFQRFKEFYNIKELESETEYTNIGLKNSITENYNQIMEYLK